MDWRIRSIRRPAVNEPGHAYELTFSCFHRYPFLKAERTCQWLADAVDEACKDLEFALWAYVAGRSQHDDIALVGFGRTAR